MLGNSVDAVKATGFPIGDTIVAQECDPTSSFRARCFGLRWRDADFGYGGRQRQSGVHLPG